MITWPLHQKNKWLKQKYDTLTEGTTTIIIYNLDRLMYVHVYNNDLYIYTCIY